MRYVVFLFLAAILYCLGSAFHSLIPGSKSGSRGLQHFISRIALAVGLFALLMVCYKLGWINGQV